VSLGAKIGRLREEIYSSSGIKATLGPQSSCITTAVPSCRSEDEQPWELVGWKLEVVGSLPVRSRSCSHSRSTTVHLPCSRGSKAWEWVVLVLVLSDLSFLLSFINSRSHSPAVVMVADSGPWVINPFNHFGLCLFAPVVLSYCKYVLFCSRGSRDYPILSVHRYFSLSLLVSRALWSTGPFRCS